MPEGLKAIYYKPKNINEETSKTTQLQENIPIKKDNYPCNINDLLKNKHYYETVFLFYNSKQFNETQIYTSNNSVPDKITKYLIKEIKENKINNLSKVEIKERSYILYKNIEGTQTNVGIYFEIDINFSITKNIYIFWYSKNKIDEQYKKQQNEQTEYEKNLKKWEDDKNTLKPDDYKDEQLILNKKI